jgi:hypothetical protein
MPNDAGGHGRHGTCFRCVGVARFGSAIVNYFSLGVPPGMLRAGWRGA